MYVPTTLAPGLLALSLLAPAPPAGTHSGQDAPARAVEAAAAAAFEELISGGVSGAAVVVAVGGEPLVARGWGYADAASHEPATPESAFPIGGLGGPFVVVGILQRIEAGALELEAPIAGLLGLEEDAFEGVRLRHLLEHTSGVPDAQDLLLASSGAELRDADALIARIADLPLEADPGSCCEDSETDTLLLGRILERSTGLDLAECLVRDQFQALELEGTGFDEDRLGDVEIPHPLETDGLYGSALDLMRWHRALAERELVSDRSWRRMVTPVVLPDGSTTGRGYAYWQSPLGDVEGFTFGGSLAGGTVHVATYPSADLTVVVVASAEDAPLDRIERRLARAWFDQPQPGVSDLELTEEQREVYVGDYYVGCTRIGIRAEGARLRAIWADGPELDLLYQGHDLFVAADDHEVRLTFEVEEGERASSFLLDDHGFQTVARRLE